MIREVWLHQANIPGKPRASGDDPPTVGTSPERRP